MIVVLVALTLLASGGVALAVGETPIDSLAPITEMGGSRRLAIRWSGGLVTGWMVATMSGWVVPGVVVGVGVSWVIGSWQRRPRSGSEVATLEALASWVESVRDVLLAGEQPLGAINASAAACPVVIRPAVRRLAAGLGTHDPEQVFRRFADELDDPLADVVAAGLAIAIRRGARTVPVLTALAEQTRSQVDRRRLVEAERAPARREAQALTVVMGALLLGLFVFGRSDYLDAYDSVGGQLFLGTAVAAYGVLIARIQRLAAFPRPRRFLVGGREVPA